MWAANVPFNRRFKMDLRSTSAGVEIPIWVDGAEKWLTGLTRRTTCDDIIYALLSTERREELASAHTYAIYERWRDVERPLQGRTKILKVWKAWGLEQRNVKLQLQKFEDLHYSVEWVRTRRRHPRRSRSRSSSSKGSLCKCPTCAPRDRPAVRGVLHKPQSLESLVETVLTQEEQIQALYRRIQDTDRLIECFETQTHHHRLQHNGQNYVQDAYLESLSDESSEDLAGGMEPAAMEQYLQVCDSIISLEDRIMEERQTIQNLSVTLKQEMENQLESYQDFIGQEPYSVRISINPRDLRVEINRSIASNLDHGIQLENLSKEIRLCNHEWQQKKALLDSLLTDLEMARACGWESGSCPQRSTTDLNDNPVSVPNNPYLSSWREENILLMRQKGISIDSRSYMATQNKQDDNDSDTGLSSMHSDESPGPLETLV